MLASCKRESRQRLASAAARIGNLCGQLHLSNESSAGPIQVDRLQSQLHSFPDMAHTQPARHAHVNAMRATTCARRVNSVRRHRLCLTASLVLVAAKQVVHHRAGPLRMWAAFGLPVYVHARSTGRPRRILQHSTLSAKRSVVPSQESAQTLLCMAARSAAVLPGHR